MLGVLSLDGDTKWPCPSQAVFSDSANKELREIKTSVDVGDGPKEEIVAFISRGADPTKIHKQACKRAVIAVLITEPSEGLVPVGTS